MNDIDRATKAKAILESYVFVDAFKNVRGAIIKRLECPQTNTQAAEDLRRCLRVIGDVRMNLEAAISSGKLEVFRLEQDAKRKKSPLRFFR